MKRANVLRNMSSMLLEELPEPALYTDDTQMSLAVAEALIRAGGRNLDGFMECLKEEFIKWLHSPESKRAPGRTCIAGVSRMESGVHWKESGDPNSKGCGSAMRVAPIGIFFQDNPEKLKEYTIASSICTHGHPTAIAASVGAAYAVKLLLDGIDPNNLLPEIFSFTAGISEEWDQALEKVQTALAWKYEDEALVYLGEGWVAEEAVSLALYCFLKYPDSFRDVVIRAANTNGDSDSVACIAGGFSGAYLGIKAMINSWCFRIERDDYLSQMAMILI